MSHVPVGLQAADKPHNELTTLNVWPIKMSEHPQSRNRYVLRTESGHPGYKNVVILATPPDLLKLSEDIRELSNKGAGRVDHYVTEEKKPTSRGSIAFEVISERDLGDLQRGDLKDWFSRKFGCVLFFLLSACAVYGGYTLILNLLGSMK